MTHQYQSAKVSLVVACLFTCAMSAVSMRDDPVRFANTIIEGCGRTGDVKEKSEGVSASTDGSTSYKVAEFDVACQNQDTGAVIVQLATNEPPVVTYQLTNSTERPTKLRGPNPDALVEQAIRAVCGCGTPR